MRRRVRKALLGILCGVIVLVLVAVGAVVWTVQQSFPQVSGTIAIAGLDSRVTVSRDASGIPTVAASTSHDLFMAQGYVQAQDRFWEMDFRRHVTAGRLSELFGSTQVKTDEFIRTLGWRRVAAEEVARLDPKTLGYYQAYADGVNAYLKNHTGAALSLEYSVLALQTSGYKPEPWTPTDSVAWLKAMAWDLRSNLQDEVARALMAETLTSAQIADLYPPYPYGQNPTIINDVGATATTIVAPAAYVGGAGGPVDELGTTLAALPSLLGRTSSDLGSNAWVVSGRLTATGKPLLANDPHLTPTMPSIWYQMGLRCTAVTAGCPFDVAGFSFSGMPGIIIGHNQRVAWGFSNLGPDVADLFVEKVTGNSYELDGALHSLTQRTETIRVAGGHPVKIAVRSTDHGPLVTDITQDFARIAKHYPAAAGLPAGSYQLSLQWTALTPGETPRSIFALDLARNWKTFRGAARLFEVPSQNLVYADVDGNIGYQAPGLIPIRSQGDGTLPQPGWTSAARWTGYIPFNKLPTTFNPPAGFIVTANNAVVNTSYPYLITRDWDPGYRAARATALIQGFVDRGHKITSADLSSIQADNHNVNAQKFAPYLAALRLTGNAKKGQRLLTGWNDTDDVNSAQSAFFNVFWRTLLQHTFATKLPRSAPPEGGSGWFEVVDGLLDRPDSPWWSERDGSGDRDAALTTALSTAWEESTKLMGTDPKAWKWGTIHSLTLTNETFGESGIAPIEWLFNRGPYPVSGGSSEVDATGWYVPDGYEVEWVPSMREVIDLAHLDSSTWINLGGESGHAFDQNYVDQTGEWQHHVTRPWPFTPHAVAAAARNVLTLIPTRSGKT